MPYGKPRGPGRPRKHPDGTLSRTTVTISDEARSRGHERARELGISFSAYLDQLIARDVGQPSRAKQPASGTFKAIPPDRLLTIDDALRKCCPSCGADEFEGYTTFTVMGLFNISCRRCLTVAVQPLAKDKEGFVKTFLFEPIE